jgi:catalase
MKNLVYVFSILLFTFLISCDKKDNDEQVKSTDNPIIETQSNSKDSINNETALQNPTNNEEYSEPCDEEASNYVLENMAELTSKIDKTNRTYFISHSLWISMTDEQKKGLITSVADAHACIEKKAYKIQFIDDLTDDIIAQAHPDLGIKVID